MGDGGIGRVGGFGHGLFALVREANRMP
jgi:hypothetical protein